MSEEQAEYIAEAKEMLGNGYTHSPLEIHPAQTVISRRGWGMQEEVIPAFIKISTDFKAELKLIDATSLKVWIFLALSINRNTEQAHPGIRTIAEACGMGQNTVIAAVKDLERVGLLTVNREDRKYNIYEIPAYVSANNKTASITEAVAQTASVNDQTASVNDKTASVSRRLNQSNQREPENTRAPLSQENLEKANKKVDALLKQEKTAQEKQASGASWPGRETIPEPIRDLLDVYVQLTGQRPAKKNLLDWLQTGGDWLEAGISAEDLRAAYKKSKPDNGEGFMVSRPGSLTTVAGMFAGERRKQTDPQTGTRVLISAPPVRKNDFVSVDLSKPILPQLERANR